MLTIETYTYLIGGSAAILGSLLTYLAIDFYNHMKGKQ